MRFETSLLDKIVNRGLLGKRSLGRPLKALYKNKHQIGILEIMYKPRNKIEAVIGKFIHASLPALAYFTLRFQIEKTRESGLRIEDQYHHKFFREPYIYWHIYAQNFHPSTLHERIRNVHFYRKPRTLFKGFKVPDWAQSQKGEAGFEIDMYSRELWDQALTEARSEWSPAPFNNPRVEGIALNWFRFEQYGKGHSSRLFYNETPNPMFYRHGGHFDDVEGLHSFKYADQHHEDILGFDTTTTEGRKALIAEIKRYRTMVPELFEHDTPENLDELSFDGKYVSKEAHFQRMFNHYRKHVFNNHVREAVESGKITEDDASAAKAFFDHDGLPSASMIALGQKGLLSGKAGYSSFVRLLDAVGLGEFKRCPRTAMPIEEQFTKLLDSTFKITEAGMNKALPLLVVGSKQRDKVRAMIDAGETAAAILPKESTKRLA